MNRDIPFRILRGFCAIFVRTLLIWSGGYKFSGQKNVPKKGGVLIVPNHIRDGDPPVVVFAIPRYAYCMAKEELFAIKFWGKMIVWLKGFPIKRGTADRKALKFAEERMVGGEAVIIFAEGKLSEDGELQPFFPGALLVAKRANVPIIPTAIVNTNLMMPYGIVVPRRAKCKIEVRFGEPKTYQELSGGDESGTGMRLAAERLHDLVYALQQGFPAPVCNLEAGETSKKADQNG